MSTVSSPVVPSRPTAHAGFPPVPPSSFPSARWPRSSALATSPACSAPSTAAHCAAPTGSPRSLLPPPLPRGSRAPLLGVGRLLQTAVCWSRARACLSRALHPPRGPLQPSASTSSFAASCSTSCRPASSDPPLRPARQSPSSRHARPVPPPLGAPTAAPSADRIRARPHVPPHRHRHRALPRLSARSLASPRSPPSCADILGYLMSAAASRRPALRRRRHADHLCPHHLWPTSTSPSPPPRPGPTLLVLRIHARRSPPSPAITHCSCFSSRRPHDRIPVRPGRAGFSPPGFIRHARRTTDKSPNVIPI